MPSLFDAIYFFGWLLWLSYLRGMMRSVARGPGFPSGPVEDHLFFGQFLFGEFDPGSG